MTTPLSPTHALAKALGRAGVPARAEHLGDGYSAEIELSVDGRYHRLYLRPEYPDHAVLWMLLDSHGEEVDSGVWKVRLRPRLLRHHRTVTLLRRWLRERYAIPGPIPTPTWERLVGEETNCWMWVFDTTAHRYATALVEGRAGADATPQDLARLYPDFTAEHGLMDGDGWESGIDIIHAFAHGRVFEEHDTPRTGDYIITVSCDLAERFGPQALARLQVGFGGDVVAAAHAFLARHR
ncbi:hypothetical protein OG871_40370 (plasmid) [Kitasatospora sp. NBC_00374]|uniref:hypothetical protein n=1 Tax=Kitasatospora sp. NBC_00374 TaxID=2975964 RepID=UPI002F913B63